MGPLGCGPLFSLNSNRVGRCELNQRAKCLKVSPDDLEPNSSFDGFFFPSRLSRIGQKGKKKKPVATVFSKS